jgi:anti-sigma regulatory factor (Ser/Thr protein kinase)
VSTLLFAGDVLEETSRQAVFKRDSCWTVLFASDLEEVEQRLQRQPVDALVGPLEQPGLPLEELITVARSNGVPLIVCGDAPPAAVEQSGVAGYVQRVRFTSTFAGVLDEVLEAESARRLREELEAGVHERFLKMTVGNDKGMAPAVVRLLMDECNRMNAIREEDQFRVAIALEEALVNAIVHGNLEVSSELREACDDRYEETIALRRTLPEYRDRVVTVCCTINRERIEFRITDEGSGFDVSAIPDPTDPDYLERPCGRGLLLMRSFMDEVRYNGRGNSVTLIKRIPGQPSVADETDSLAVPAGCR